jgi:hypothetical protein
VTLSDVIGCCQHISWIHTVPVFISQGIKKERKPVTGGASGLLAPPPGSRGMLAPPPADGRAATAGVRSFQQTHAPQQAPSSSSSNSLLDPFDTAPTQTHSQSSSVFGFGAPAAGGGMLLTPQTFQQPAAATAAVSEASDDPFGIATQPTLTSYTPSTTGDVSNLLDL